MANIIPELLIAGTLWSCAAYTGAPVPGDLSVNKDIEWVKNRTKSLSPSSWNMLMKYDALPSNPTVPQAGGGTVSSQKTTDTFFYLQGSNRLELLNSMETNVHEIAHGFFSQNVFQYVTDNGLALDWDKVEGYIYIDPDISFFISFPRKSLFPSSELIPSIPKDLRTFRFDPYIRGNTSTQGQGVLGLLDELHAYYLGSGCTYDLLEAYKEATGSDSEGFFEWVNHAQSTMSAYYEFDFFIREYLLRMKNNYPADYETLRSYPQFSIAYNKLCASYENLIKRYLDLIHTEMQRLNSSGKSEARIESGQLWIRAAGSRISNGTQLFSGDRDKLLPVLKSGRYDAVLKDFGIQK